MGLRVGVIILFVLGSCWACDSRKEATSCLLTGATETSDDSVLQINSTVKKENICTLCEEFTTDALNYLSANKTQTEIMSILHESCSKLQALKQECLVLVDYYAPLFFSEISSIQPEEFCQKVNLCEQVAFISQRLDKDSCEFCKQTVAEALLKLKDPDTRLEIITLLLKGCNSIKGYEKKCKRMVFEYGPIIIANAEHLLESNDICTVLHACGSPKSNPEQQSVTSETIMIASS